MTASRGWTVLALFLVVGLPLSASGQNGGQNEGAPQMAKFRLADSYLRTGSYERAIPLLEQLHEQNPSSHVFYEKLKEAYAGVKQYDRAVDLVDARLERERNPALLSEKAALLLQKGEKERAIETWNEAVQLRPDHAGSYRTVYHSMIDNRVYEEAIEILRRGRRQLEAPARFTLDLAYLYSLTSQHAEAAREYLALLERTPERLSLVKQRLSRFSEESGALLEALPVVERAVEERPLYRPFRELAGWLYVQTEQYGPAFQTYQAIDRLEDERGRALLEFGRRAASDDAYDPARRAYHYVLDGYPDGPATPEALLGLADLHRSRARALSDSTRTDTLSGVSPTEAARSAYEQFADRYSGHPRHAHALFQLGRIQLNHDRDLEAAERRFDQIIHRYPDSPQAQRAQLSRGRVFVLQDSLDKADRTFTHVQDTVGDDAIRALARYEIALLEFYRGRFRSAVTRARALGRNGARDVANDAVTLQVLIQENRGPDSLDRPLRSYARARLADRQHRYEDAEARLDSLLATYPNHSLVDEALFLKGEVLSRTGASERAARTYESLAEDHRTSPLADRSLRAAARLYERRLDRPDRAVELYGRLLDRYPGSPYRQEVRERIRGLRGQV